MPSCVSAAAYFLYREPTCVILQIPLPDILPQRELRDREIQALTRSSLNPAPPLCVLRVLDGEEPRSKLRGIEAEAEDLTGVSLHATISCRALLHRKQRRIPVCLVAATGRQGTPLQPSFRSDGACLRTLRFFYVIALEAPAREDQSNPGNEEEDR